MTGALVIVEGTCGAGKTTLLRAAERMFADREVRVLQQRVTYKPIAPLEDAGTLDDAANLRILRELVAQLRDELAGPRRLVLVDTLHATHLVRAGALRVASFRVIDDALAALGALVVVLRIGEASIRDRAIVGRRGTGFSAYARKFGETEDERTRYFVHEQERLLALVREHSRLPPVELDGDAPVEVVQARFRDAVRVHLGG